jgi:hypothetical protein
MKLRIIHFLYGRFVLFLFIATALQTYVIQAEGDQRIASNGPVSLKEARSINLGIPLPDSASEIQYDLRVGGLQQMSLFLRFQVDPKDADHAVQAIIDNNNRMMKRSLAFPSVQLPIPEAGPKDHDVHQQGTNHICPNTPSWWRTHEITVGYIRSELASYAPAIFLDKKRSIIYVRQID